MLSEHRDLAAAKRFFRSAKAITGVIPDRVTTDGHDAYPQAIRTILGKRVRHRTNSYLNNRLEQDHRGIKGRCRSMLGFKSTPSAKRYCQSHDELGSVCMRRPLRPSPASTAETLATRLLASRFWPVSPALSAGRQALSSSMLARGTLPLALFGPTGYGLRTGTLSAPARLLQGGAPLLFGIVLDRAGPLCAFYCSQAHSLVHLSSHSFH
jgi:hypothetical protein